MRFSVLASGSTGNAFFIETDETRLLVDAGLSGRRIEQLFQQINKDPSDLTGILVTHEHSDHIRGLGVLARKYRLPVYANRKTWQAMDQAIGTLEVGQKFEFEVDQVKTFGDLDVQSFEVSHDAVEPMFFTFHQGDKKVALVTDLGYVSEHIKKTVEDADAYIFEANHDVGMLQMGRYPWNVKRRILSDSGHVSNEDCGYALCDVIGNRTKRIYLAHLSQDNNMKELAQLSVDQILQDHGIRMDLQHTDPKIPTPLYSV